MRCGRSLAQSRPEQLFGCRAPSAASLDRGARGNARMCTRTKAAETAAEDHLERRAVAFCWRLCRPVSRRRPAEHHNLRIVFCGCAPRRPECGPLYRVIAVRLHRRWLPHSFRAPHVPARPVVRRPRGPAWRRPSWLSNILVASRPPRAASQEIVHRLGSRKRGHGMCPQSFVRSPRAACQARAAARAALWPGPRERDLPKRRPPVRTLCNAWVLTCRTPFGARLMICEGSYGDALRNL